MHKGHLDIVDYITVYHTVYYTATLFKSCRKINYSIDRERRGRERECVWIYTHIHNYIHTFCIKSINIYDLKINSAHYTP